MPAIAKPRRSAKSSRQSYATHSRGLRGQFAISQALLARLMNVSLRSISSIESSGSIPPTLRRDLVQVQRLCDALGDLMNPRHVGAWLDEPNEMLGNLKPVESIERGQIDLVWQVVEGLRTGSQL